MPNDSVKNKLLNRASDASLSDTNPSFPNSPKVQWEIILSVSLIADNQYFLLWLVFDSPDILYSRTIFGIPELNSVKPFGSGKTSVADPDSFGSGSASRSCGSGPRSRSNFLT